MVAMNCSPLTQVVAQLRMAMAGGDGRPWTAWQILISGWQLMPTLIRLETPPLPRRPLSCDVARRSLPRVKSAATRILFTSAAIRGGSWDDEARRRKMVALAATIVGIVGNIIATGLFLSPIPTFIRICKERSTKDFKGLPYVVTLTNCLLWVWYGLPWVKTNIPVITINALGAALQLTYVSIYLVFAPWNKRARTVPFLVALVAFIGTVVAITLAVCHSAQSRKMFVGILCVVFTTGMNIAPLAIMRLVIATRSVEFMPFYLSLFVFANGCAWAIYGLLTSDIFIIIPNCLGALLGAVQLILYVIYKRAKPRRVEDDKGQAPVKAADVEMGQQQTVS